VDRDSSVGIVTCNGLDGLGIESWWGARFSTLIQTGPRAHPASCTMGTGSFLEVKWPGHGVDHPPSSSTKVKERLELYHYSPSGPLWPVVGWTFFSFLSVVHLLLCNMVSFYGEELLAPRPTPSWRTNPCRLSATAYSIYSWPPSLLKAVPSSATCVCAMPWWQEPTYDSG